MRSWKKWRFDIVWRGRLFGATVPIFLAICFAPGPAASQALKAQGLKAQKLKVLMAQATAAKAPAPDRFENEVLAFEAADKKTPPLATGTLFIGSSTFAHWQTLANEFRDISAINRGFGGSTIPEVNHYFSRLVLPYKPAKIVFYAGTNDIANGHRAEQVVADFRTFLELVHKNLPDTQVYFISMSVAPSRLQWADVFNSANKGIAAISEKDSNLHFIDVTKIMRDANGKLHDDYFEPDRLHMNKAGYAAWYPVIRQAVGGIELPAIDAAADAFHDSNPALVKLFRAGLLNTKKQVRKEADGSYYVATGDIPAEWLRDSSAQVRPYLYFAKQDKAVAAFIRGVIARQAKYLYSNPYANAFREDGRVWEEKFELDSLCYPVILAWTYYKATGDKSIFTPEFAGAMDKVLETMEREQDHPDPVAKAARGEKTYSHPSLANDGRGSGVGYTGMVWTGFRPSDDNCKYHYLIPAEMMAVVALAGLEEVESTVYKNETRAALARRLRGEIDAGIQKYGIVDEPGFGKIYAYEVDGLGQEYLIDDANIPSLLAAPYFGYVKSTEPIYLSTRKFILSSKNPFYSKGKLAKGIGSPHTPAHYVWPLSLVMQGLTAAPDAISERADVKKYLLACDPGDHLLHESFDPNNQKKFTRLDFGWPNALFAEYLMLERKMVEPLPLPDLSK